MARNLYAQLSGMPDPTPLPRNYQSPALECEGMDKIHRGQPRFAYRLAAAHGHRLMHVHGIGWHYYDGIRWARDDRGETRRAVLGVLRTAWEDSFGDKDLAHDVRRCESASGVSGILDLASSLRTFATTVDELDSDPYLLNTTTGTLDLRTGELRAHGPHDRITKVTGAGFDMAAQSPAWDTFLEQVLPDPQVRAFLQRLVGLALVGRVVEHVLPILTGTGRNGKGATTRLLLKTLGDYAIEAEPELLLFRDRAHPTGQLDLRGVRLATMQETDEGKRLAVATMKRLTGGDIIRARAMRQDFVEFEPSHSAVMITNHLPAVPADDPALWARLLVVPFDVSFAGREDPALEDRLALELPGILAWAYRGYVDYLNSRLDPPEAVRVATKTYKVNSDALAQFIDEKCLTGPGHYARSAQLWSVWLSWSKENAIESGNSRRFKEAMETRGFTSRKTKLGNVFDGLALAGNDDEEGL